MHLDELAIKPTNERDPRKAKTDCKHPELIITFPMPSEIELYGFQLQNQFCSPRIAILTYAAAWFYGTSNEVRHDATNAGRIRKVSGRDEFMDVYAERKPPNFIHVNVL
jgi:hypothetical protein